MVHVPLNFKSYLLIFGLVKSWNIFVYFYSSQLFLFFWWFLKSALLKKFPPCCYLNWFLCYFKLNPLFLVYQFSNLNQHPLRVPSANYCKGSFLFCLFLFSVLLPQVHWKLHSDILDWSLPARNVLAILCKIQHQASFYSHKCTIKLINVQISMSFQAMTKS